MLSPSSVFPRPRSMYVNIKFMLTSQRFQLGQLSTLLLDFMIAYLICLKFNSKFLYFSLKLFTRYEV